MSRPTSLALDDSVRRHDIETDRGTFVTWLCSPGDSSLPHGNVLLVPGFTGSKEDFAPLLPLLADAGWQVATYDQRGQFETAADAGDDFSLDAYAADLISTTEALFGAAERTHLVGHSFGGLVAAAAVIARPDRWASLTLLCSGPGGFEGAKRQELLDGADLIEREGLEVAHEARSRRDLERGREAPAPAIEAFLRNRFLSNSAASLAAIARLLAHTPDLTEQLAAAGVPVSVVRGEDDDAWDHEVQERLADALGTSVVVIAKAGHSPASSAPRTPVTPSFASGCPDGSGRPPALGAVSGRRPGYVALAMQTSQLDCLHRSSPTSGGGLRCLHRKATPARTPWTAGRTPWTAAALREPPAHCLDVGRSAGQD